MLLNDLLNKQERKHVVSMYASRIPWQTTMFLVGKEIILAMCASKGKGGVDCGPVRKETCKNK